MRRIESQIILSFAMAAACSLVCGQEGAARAAIEQSLIAKYPLTKPTADNTNIVTAGSILTLQKDNLVMVSVSSANPYQNTYKNGMITQNALSIFRRIPSGIPGVPKVPGGGAPAGRTFVAGEKMWLTKIEVKDDGVVFTLLTDAISDVRYKATLRLSISKGSMKSFEQVDAVLGQVFTFQAPDNTNAPAPQLAPAAGSRPGPPGGTQGDAAAPVPAAPPAASPEPQVIIAPPPPPPADAPAAPPKTIAIGQTKDHVVASFGQPERIVKLAGSKEIYSYKDLKVIFVGGKVTDVQ